MLTSQENDGRVHIKAIQEYISKKLIEKQNKIKTDRKEKGYTT